MAKNCGHNQTCVECTRAEIQQLEAKIRALRASLPQVIVAGCGCWGHNCHHMQAVPMPFWNGNYPFNNMVPTASGALGGQFIGANTLTAGSNIALANLHANAQSNTNLGLPSGNSAQYGSAQ